jgi:hypothetical protein
MKTLRFSVMVMVMLAWTLPVFAQEDSSAGQTEQPPMGPPEEIKLLEPMVGNWTFKGEMIAHPGAEPEPLEATAVIAYVCGGAALQFEYTGDMMGMTLHGLSLTTYNSETAEWQEVWTDNFGGRFSIYSGTFEDGRLVVGGTELHMGQTMHSRITRWDMTEASFQWQMETSMDGEEWSVSMSGTYTKQ